MLNLQPAAKFHDLRASSSVTGSLWGAAYIIDHFWDIGWEHFIPLGHELSAAMAGN